MAKQMAKGNTGIFEVPTGPEWAFYLRIIKRLNIDITQFDTHAALNTALLDERASQLRDHESHLILVQREFDAEFCTIREEIERMEANRAAIEKAKGP